MKEYFDAIFSAKTTEQVCASLQKALDSLKTQRCLERIPGYYEDIAARNPAEVEEWFDEMKDDEQAQEEGHLKEVYGLFDAALRQLRMLGLHRQ